MQPVVQPTAVATTSSFTPWSQIVRLGDTMQEYNNADNAFHAEHWFCLCGK